MRVQRSKSTSGQREYTTVNFNGHDILAALAEYAERHGHISDSELRGFKLHWNMALRYVEGHGLQNFIYLKIAREVQDANQPDEDEETGQISKGAHNME